MYELRAPLFDKTNSEAIYNSQAYGVTEINSDENNNTKLLWYYIFLLYISDAHLFDSLEF